MDFSTSEITSKKVRGNHVDFSTIEITSKKYAEMTWKFVEILSATYRRNVHVESTWIQRGVPVGMLHVRRYFKTLNKLKNCLLVSVTFFLINTILETINNDLIFCVLFTGPYFP